ncbi:hypothetical protein ABVT39_025231, partial [Epinephelus coioides]
AAADNGEVSGVYFLYPCSFRDLHGDKVDLLATPLLQSHPAFRDKENTEDQFCSVTFGGGLQSK